VLKQIIFVFVGNFTQNEKKILLNSPCRFFIRTTTNENLINSDLEILKVNHNLDHFPTIKRFFLSPTKLKNQDVSQDRILLQENGIQLTIPQFVAIQRDLLNNNTTINRTDQEKILMINTITDDFVQRLNVFCSENVFQTGTILDKKSSLKNEMETSDSSRAFEINNHNILNLDQQLLRIIMSWFTFVLHNVGKFPLFFEDLTIYDCYHQMKSCLQSSFLENAQSFKNLQVYLHQIFNFKTQIKNNKEVLVFPSLEVISKHQICLNKILMNQ
jgi:hypothetical protein